MNRIGRRYGAAVTATALGVFAVIWLVGVGTGELPLTLTDIVGFVIGLAVFAAPSALAAGLPLPRSRGDLRPGVGHRGRARWVVPRRRSDRGLGHRSRHAGPRRRLAGGRAVLVRLRRWVAPGCGGRHPGRREPPGRRVLGAGACGVGVLVRRGRRGARRAAYPAPNRNDASTRPDRLTRNHHHPHLMCLLA